MRGSPEKYTMRGAPEKRGLEARASLAFPETHHCI